MFNKNIKQEIVSTVLTGLKKYKNAYKNPQMFRSIVNKGAAQ